MTHICVTRPQWVEVIVFRGIQHISLIRNFTPYIKNTHTQISKTWILFHLIFIGMKFNKCEYSTLVLSDFVKILPEIWKLWGYISPENVALFKSEVSEMAARYSKKTGWIPFLLMAWPPSSPGHIDFEKTGSLLSAPWGHCLQQPVSFRRWKWHTWWRHQMETFSALLVFCAGNSPVTSEFPAQRPVTRSFEVFFDLHLNNRFRSCSGIDKELSHVNNTYSITIQILWKILFTKISLLVKTSPQIYIYHDSTAVVSCAKVCSDQFPRIWIRAKWNYRHIWIVMEKLLIKCLPVEQSVPSYPAAHVHVVPSHVPPFWQAGVHCAELCNIHIETITLHASDVTWASLCLSSPATRMCVHQLVQDNEIIKRGKRFQAVSSRNTNDI